MRQKKFLTDEWIKNWRTSCIEEIADTGCKGLVIRGGPSGVKTFIRSRGTRKAIGHYPETSLAQAREAVTTDRERRRVEVPGSIPT